ncbi:MAG: DUF4287 domain-containing protein [Dehalococcoidia bacterium]|nr:DUF4287 domain-containing protein [Dehalococcoidia bacterium]
MNEQEQARRSVDIGDTAVKASTGKTWAEWFAILDGAGATRMSHKEIVTYLGEHHQVPEWWQQMVTVTYEQSRGLREKHETPGGFQVSVTKTIAVPVDKLRSALCASNQSRNGPSLLKGRLEPQVQAPEIYSV